MQSPFIQTENRLTPGVVPALQALNPLEEPGWDERLQAHPNGCFFHGSAWARVLRDSYGLEPIFFTIQNNATLGALLPVVEVKSWLTGRRAVSIAYADFCPPIVSGETSYGPLLQEVIAAGRGRNWRSLECRGGFELLTEVPSSASFYGHTLDLSVGETELLKRFEGRVRNAIRRAQSSGVEVKMSRDAGHLEEFYKLHCQTRRRHGLPPQPLLFFRSIYDRVLTTGYGLVALATLRDRPVAAAVFFHFGQQAIYKYSASHPAFQSLRPNNLLMWEAIRWYARAGFAELDFGRTSPLNEGLRLYKRGFGTRERELHYFKYDYRQCRFRAGREAAPGWMNSICRRLPISVLRVAGRCLYRHLA